MRIVNPLVLGLALFTSGCSLNSHSSMLVLEPQLTATQAVREGHSQSVTMSRQFHTVEVSPHPILAPDREWRFYIQIINGSALDTDFHPENLAVYRNGIRIAPYTKAQIQQRILDAKVEALREIASQVDPIRASRRDLKDDTTADLSAGQYIEEMRRHDADMKEQRREVERVTRNKLQTLDSYALSDRTLKPGEHYKTFVEVPLTQPVKAGDEFVLRIGIEPDVHEFRYRIAQM